MKNYLTTAEAAARLHISDSRVRHLIKEGRLKAIKLGRDNRIPEAALATFAKRPAGWPKGKRRGPRRPKNS